MENSLSEKEINKLLNVLLSDGNLEAILDVLFSKKEVVNNEIFVDGLREIASEKLGKTFDTYFDQLKTDTNEFNYFIGLMGKFLWKNTFMGELDEFVIVTLEELTIWLLFAVSIKKCLGIRYAKEKLTETRYYPEMRYSVNDEQKKAHSQCVSYFSNDVSRFSLKRNPLLRIFLHSFHGRNKAIKTKKKNIRRVIKRAERYMILNRLYHRNECVFQNGKYLVPKQFGETIIRIYLRG